MKGKSVFNYLYFPDERGSYCLTMADGKFFVIREANNETIIINVGWNRGWVYLYFIIGKECTEEI